MKISYKLNEGTTLEQECASLQDAIKAITEIRESIGYEPCGKCQSENTYPRHRVAEDNDFYEIYCADCYSVLQLGTAKESKQLYKKRMQTDSKGKAVKVNDKAQYLPDKGWVKYNKETGKNE